LTGGSLTSAWINLLVKSPKEEAKQAMNFKKMVDGAK